jgi:hypothetical protein
MIAAPAKVLLPSIGQIGRLHDISVFGLLCAAMLLIFVSLTPTLAIHDDAYAYVEGAHSLRQNLGYIDTSGTPLNTWPPGYSFILSQFSNPLRAAYWINALSFVLAVSELFLAAIQNSWPRLAALGFAGAFGAGFLYSLATAAKPDILTYAVFLTAMSLVLHERPWSRTIGFVLVSALIPLKMIAVIFLPAIVLHDASKLKLSNLTGPRIEYLIGGSAWLAAAGFVLAFNFKTIGTLFGPYHELASLHGFVFQLWMFVLQFFRSFVANWYGPIGAPIPLAIFTTVLIIGLGALTALRRPKLGASARHIGVIILVLSWALEPVRPFDAEPRLMGYGMLLVLLGCAPNAAAGPRWVAYAAASLAASVLNTLLVDRSGAGHPQYAAMALQVGPFLDPIKPLYTNSRELVDVHLGKRSIRIHELPVTDEAACFLYVQLPNRDTMETSVWPIAVPTEPWTIKAEVEGAKLYCQP